MPPLHCPACSRCRRGIAPACPLVRRAHGHSSNRTSKAVRRERARAHASSGSRHAGASGAPAARQRMGIGRDRRPWPVGGHVCGRPRARSVSSGRSHESRGAGRPRLRPPGVDWAPARAVPCRAVRRRLTCLTRHLFVRPRKRRARRGRRRLPAVDHLEYIYFSFLYREAVPVRPEAGRARDRRRAFIGAAGSRIPTALPCSALHQRLRRKPYLLLLLASGTKRHDDELRSCLVCKIFTF